MLQLPGAQSRETQTDGQMWPDGQAGGPTELEPTPSANMLCLSLLCRLWGWMRPLLHISSKQMCTLAAWLAKSEHYIWNSQCGSHSMETINPGFTWGLQHRLSILFTSRPGYITGSLQTSCNTN